MSATALLINAHKQKVLFASLLYLVFVISLTYLNVINKKQSLYQQLDQQLEEAAVTVPLLLPSTLHHKNMVRKDLSKQQIHGNMLALSKFTDQRDIINIYTLILEDEKVLFSASSATPEARKTGEKLSSYLGHYDDVDARVFDIFKTKEKSFLEYTNQWETFRSVYLPSYSADGTFYLSVADHTMTHIQSALNEQIYKSIFIAILFFIFAYPLYYTATIGLKHNAKRLSEELQRQALALKDSQDAMIKNQSVLFTLAKESYIDQKSALTNIITAAALQLDVPRVGIWLFDKEKTVIISQAMYNQGKIDFSHQSIESKDYPHYFTAIKSTGFISADNAHTHPATKGFLKDYLLPYNIRSILDTPIYNEGELIGVMSCENLTVQRKWSSEEQDFARSMSYLMGQVFLNEQRKQAETLLFQQAHYDALTNLPNRVLFADRFSQAVAHSKRSKTLLALCFLDLDNFKPVNDTYGHETGDHLLIEVASRITAALREEDTVSRQGGDEFTLVLGNIESSLQCELVLRRISAAIQRPCLIDGHICEISASIGATLYPNDNADLDTLLRHADHAMYQAKLAGKNQLHFFNPADDLQVTDKRNKLQEIRQALVKNEFSLHYQPKVNMKSGKVFGAEALIRWHHPHKGMVAPLDFLPAIEGTELEVDIGNWVINEALQQLNHWQQQGIDLEISVNISSFHLQSLLFFDQLKVALAKHPDIKSQRLQLEILESSVLADLKAISDIIKNCQTLLGVNVALDDFGTGYSSLTHIRDLSANVIKIDQSFIRDLLMDPNDYSIIEGVIGLAKAFNHDIIAEGVETTEQGIMLLIMGCEEAQGYQISRPLPAEHFPVWLADYLPNPDWLDYDQQKLTPQQQKLILLQLTTKHWYSNVLSITKGEQPRESMTSCHLSVWLKRRQHDSLFDHNWLKALIEAHDVLFNQAVKLISIQPNDDFNSKPTAISEFTTCFQNLDALLESDEASIEAQH